MATPVGSAPNGGILMSDGSVQYPKSSQPAASTPSSAPLYSPGTGYGTQQNGYNFVQTPAGGAWSKTPASQSYNPVLGASDSSSGKIDNPATHYLNVPGRGNMKLSDAMGEGLADEFGNLKTSAQSGYNSSLDAIRSRLDEAKRLAGQQRSRATEERDYVTGFVGNQIGNLITRANQAKDNTNLALGKEESSTTNEYNKAIGNARRRSASVEMQNRNRARALNRLDSSFYDDIQASNLEDTKRGLNAIDTEKADKIAGIGQRRTEAEQTYGNTVQDLETEGARLQRDAIKEYQSTLDQADALEKAGVLDFGEGQAAAQQQLQSRLDSIDGYVKQMAMRRLELQSVYDKGANTLNTYNPLDETFMNNLNDRTGLNEGTDTVSNTPLISMNGTGGLGGVQDQVANLLAMAQRRKQIPSLAA